MQLHLTTTHIRALVETTAADLCDEGKIDARQRKAVSNINGHSSATVDKYYMKRSRKHDVQHGKKMFEVLSANKPFMNDRYNLNQTESSDNDDNDIYDRYNSNQDESSDNNIDDRCTWNLSDEGKIDARPRKAVSNINGHRSATVDKYYMKRSRKHDVEHEKKMFEVLSANKPFVNDRYDSNQTQSSDNDDNDIYDRYNSNQDESSDNNIDDRCNWNLSDEGRIDARQRQKKIFEVFSANKPYMNDRNNKNESESSDNDPIIKWDFGSSTNNQPLTGKKLFIENNNMWGRLHPQYAADTQRIKWSDQEKNYIRRWLENAGQGSSQHRVKDLLNHIRKDEHARAIFHVNHIVDGTRLRHGIRTVEDEESNMVKNPYNYNKAIYYDRIP